MFKKILKGLMIVAGSVIALFLLLAVLLYIPPVQNYVAHKVCNYASQKTGMTLRVKRVKLAFPLDLALEGTFAKKSTDTVIDARYVKVDIGLRHILKKRIDIDGIEIFDSKVNTIDFISDTQIIGKVGTLKLKSHGIDFKDYMANVNSGLLKDSHITVLLSDTAKEDTTPQKPSVWLIRTGKFSIDNSSVKVRLPGDSMRIASAIGSLRLRDGFFDTRQDIYKVGSLTLKHTSANYDIPYERYVKGLDINHISLNGLNAEISNPTYKNGAFKCGIKSLSLREKSGFTLSNTTGSLYADTSRIELSGLKMATPYSTFNATGVLYYDAFERDGRGKIKLRISGRADKRDILAAVPGGLDKDISRLIPQRPINVNVELSGKKGIIRVENGRLNIDNMLSMNVAGHLDDITGKSPGISLNYSLRTQDISYLKKNLGIGNGSGIDIPYGTSATGTFNYSHDRCATNSLIHTGGGTAHVNGWFDTNTSAYSAKINTKNLPLDKIISGSGLHPLTASLTASGHGFSPFNEGTKLDAKANITQFGIGETDLSNTNLQALVRKGYGEVQFSMNNSLLHGNGHVAANIRSDFISGKLSANISKADIKKLAGGDKPLTLSSRASATFYANSKMTTYGINAAVDSILFHTDSGKTVHAKDLLVKLDNRHDSLFSRINAGDLYIAVGGKDNISRISQQIQRLVSQAEREIQDKNVDLYALRTLLPRLSLTINAGKDNPLSNFLKFHSGYTFNRLSLSLNSDPSQGLTGNGYLHSLNTGALLIDTMRLNIIQDTAGVKLNALIHNATKGNPYLFTAKLDGYLLNDGAGVDIIYKDHYNREGVNCGLKASLTDSGTTVSLYPENPVLAYRKFKVNKDNYITLLNDKTILADVDLIADDSTGLKIYANKTDSISDITLSVNKVNMRELTTSIPFAPAIAGFLSGDVHLLKDSKSQEVTAAYNLNVNDMAYEGSPLGNIGLSGTYFPNPNEESHYINSSITRESEEVAIVEGTYHGKSDSINASLELLDFPVDMFNGFTGETLSLDGKLGGVLALTGTTSRPDLNGKVLLDSVRVYSDIYVFNMRVENDSAIVKNSVLDIDTLNFYSAGNNPLVVDGSINFKDLSNVNLDMNVKASNFKIINSEKTTASEVFGTVYSDIDARVRGNLSKLNIFGKLDILPKTNVCYVLRDSPLSSESDLNSLVKFVDFSDTTSAPVKKEESTGINMLLVININELAHVHCDIDDESQSYIDVEGGGNLVLKYMPNGDMALTGRYTISNGEMKYEMPVIPLRTFYLTSGSYIDFTGDPMNPTLNLSAKERVKASVNEGDNPRSVNFDVGLQITQTLKRMGLEFTIEAPDDQTVQNQLASMSVEQRNKLAISMLATGLYLEENNTATGLRTSNALNAFLQNQVQQIAGKALKSVDLSLNVEDATSETGEANTDYSFRFSKKFWGDRVNVIIGGHVSTGEDARNDASSFIDNVTLEYRIDKSAKKYLRLFYEHDTQDPLEGKLTIAGAGIAIKKKTDKFGEVFTFWKDSDSDKKSDDKNDSKKTETKNAAAQTKRSKATEANNDDK